VSRQTYAHASEAVNIGEEDTPICKACKGYPICALEDDIRYCRCPKCKTVYRTPVHYLLGKLLAALNEQEGK
jgi:tRNA(Ile2) C34 agmatinyltransferase TiaS